MLMSSLFFFASLLVPCNSMQVFVQLCLANKVANIDQDGQTLKENITKIHHIEDGQHKLVDRGKFLSYERVIPDDFKDAYKA